MAIRTSKSSSNKTWLLVLACLVIVGLLGQADSASSSSCPPCDNADDILKPCNATLDMNSWPGTLVYQPTQQQAPCACNTNYYQQMLSCTSCQSSSSAHFSVLALSSYEQVCQMYGVTSFPAVYIPTTSSTATTAPSTTGTSTPAPDNATTGTSHSSGLASGAIAGIIVSGIALIVALAVAGYVYTRRKRELERQKEDDELYKYQETTRNSYMETPLPQYTGIQSSLPALPQLTNLRVMNPDNEEEEGNSSSNPGHFSSKFDPARTSSPGWRRGSFDDD